MTTCYIRKEIDALRKLPTSDEVLEKINELKVENCRECEEIECRW